MKNLNFIVCVAITLFMSLTVTSCYDDSKLVADIENLGDRVQSLEDWQKTVNQDISSLQTIIKALEEENYITSVSEKTNGAYTITFHDGTSIVIKDGDKGDKGDKGDEGEKGDKGDDGDTPVIGVKESEGVYYWTLNGEFLLGQDGKKIPVTGPKGDQGDKGEDGEDAVAPELRINSETNEWEISVDGGTVWTSTGVVATGANGQDGDAFFSGVDTENPDYVIFTLTDETEIIVPRYDAVTMKFSDGKGTKLTVTKGQELEIVKFTGLTEEKYEAVYTRFEMPDGTGELDVQTKAGHITLAEPVFAEGECKSLKVTFNEALEGVSILKITLIYGGGKELSVSRPIAFEANIISAGMANGDSFTLPDATTEEPVKLAEPVEVKDQKDFTLNLGGSDSEEADEADGGVIESEGTAIMVTDGQLVVEGNGEIKSSSNEQNDGPIILVEGKTAKANVAGGTYTVGADLGPVTKAAALIGSNGTAVSAEAGAVVTITNGTFQAEGKGDAPNLLTCDAKSTLIVTGGTFIGFDPSKFVLGAEMDITTGIDGETIYKVYKVNDVDMDGNIIVYSAEGLKFLAEEVNGGETYKGKTIKLGNDIDLQNQEWTPIGASGKPFSGIFDGENHTVSNLKISGNNSNVGLFGYTTGGEIKNLTVNNAEVSGYLEVGVVAGTPYTSKYTNINVTGLVKVDGFSYVGAVGGKNVYASWTDVTVDVKAGSYVNAQSESYRTYVGGVAGFVAEGKKTMTNIKSNIDVIGSTCDVGGLFGIAHYGTSYVNCSSSGNVSITAASDEGDDEEIGGIAGVWMNSASGSVTFTNCSFTGTLTTNLGADLSNNTIVGGKYNRNSTAGTLIIDDKTYTGADWK